MADQTVGEITAVASTSTIGINLSLFKLGPLLHTVFAVAITTAVMVATGATITAIGVGGSYYSPIANPDSVSTFKTIQIQIFPLSNDKDPKGGTLQLTNVETPPYGSFVLHDNRYLIYTPQLYWAGTFMVNYTASNAKLSSKSNITITVKNHAPEPVDLSYIISKNTLDNAGNVFVDTNSNGGKTTDVDQDLMFVARIITPPQHGTAKISADGQKVLYTPNKDYILTDSLQWECSDYNDTATAWIYYKVQNDPPTARPDTYTLKQNSLVVLPVCENDYDVNGDNITITHVDNTGVGKGVIYSDHTIQYFPVLGVYSDSFEYTITDGEFFSSTYVVINMVNTPPDTQDRTIIVGKNTVNNTMPLVYSDLDRFASLIVILTSQPDNGTTHFSTRVETIVDEFFPGYDSEVTWKKYSYELLYTPIHNTIGTYYYTYTVSDGIDTKSAKITVIVQNTPPIAVDDFHTTTKNIPIQVNALINDYDPNGDQIRLKLPLGVTKVNSERGGNITWVSNTTVLYRPPLNYVGIDNVTYTIEDIQASGPNLDSQGIIHITIGTIPPVAVPDVYILQKGNVINLNVIINDYDTAGDFIEVSTVGTSSYGTPLQIVNVNGIKQIQYSALDIVSPAANNDTFTYTIINPSTGLTHQTTVMVKLINTPPVANNDVVSIMWNTTYDIPVLNNDTDINSQDQSKLIISSITTGPLHGNAIIVGNIIRYTPTLGYFGVDTLQYKCNDLLADSNIATVTINVINNQPVAVNDAYTVFWGKTSTFDVIINDSDPDGNPIAIVGVTNGAHGTVTITSDNKVQYQQTDNFIGIDTFTYQITDWGKFATGNVQVTTTNTPPIATNDAYTLYWRNNMTQLAVLLNDYDNNGLTLSIQSVTQPSIGSVTISGNFILFSSSCCLGTTQFQYTISNGGGANNLATATVTITFNNPTPPSASPITQTVHWRTYVSGTILYPQPSQFTASGDQINVYLGSPNRGGSAYVQGTGIQTVLYKQKQTGSTDPFIPPWNSVTIGDEVIPYTLGDGAVNSSSTMTITTYNNAPTAQNIVLSQVNAGPITVDVIAQSNDIDSEDYPNLKVIEVTGVTNGSAIISGNKVVYTPNPVHFGDVVMTYKITDGLYNDSKTITITLIQNLATTKYYSQHWQKNPTPKSYNVTESIYGGLGQQLYLFEPKDLTQNPQVGASVDIDNSIGSANFRTNILYTQKANFTGTDVFIISYTPNGVLKNPLTVYVTSTNTPPVAYPVSATTHFINPSGVLITTNCTDPDADSTYVSQVSSTSPYGILTIVNSNTLKYVPSSGSNPYEGNVAFTYTCSDGLATSTTSGTITQTDTTPFANAFSITVPWRTYKTPFTINATKESSAGDIDNDYIYLSSIGSLSNPSAGYITKTSNNLVNVTAVSTNNFVGTVTFPFTITDTLKTTTRIATINVINNNPVANHDYYSYTGQNPSFNVQLNVLLNDTDADSDPLTITSTTKGSIVGNQISYTAPAPGFLGVDTFSYTISDGISSSTANVYVTITANPPTANPDTVYTHWRTNSSNFDVSTNDDGYFSFNGIVTNPSQGVIYQVNGPILKYKANSILSFTNTVGNLQYFLDTFTYRISSSYTLTAVGTVTVNVSNIIPTAYPDTYNINSTPTNPQQTFDVRANDQNGGDGDTLTITNIDTMTSQATITTNGQNIFYTPLYGFTGTDQFKYRVFDGMAYSQYVTVTVNVAAPTLSCSNINNNILKEQVTQINLSGYVTSTNGWPVTYALNSGNVYSKATATISGSTITYTPKPRRSTPTNHVISYDITTYYETKTCTITSTFANQYPYPAVEITSQQNKGTVTFTVDVISNWTDPNPSDIPVLKVVSVTNTSCAGAVIKPDNSLFIVMTSNTFVGTCSLNYSVSDQDLDNPLQTQASTLLIAVVTNPPVAVADYIYVKQGSGPAIIPTSTLLSNDYTIDIGSLIQFNSLIACGTYPNTCSQTPTLSGNNIIWPNSNPLSCDGDAFYYKINTVGAPNLNSIAKVTIVITNCVCTNVAIDLMFLTDASGSITSDNWLVNRQFLANVTKFFTVGPGLTQTRVGCIQFSSYTSTIINIYSTAATSQTGVYNTLAGMTQIGGGTATLAGFQAAMSAFAQIDTIPTRKSVSKVIVITTDGNPTTPCNCACCDCNSKVYSPCATTKCSVSGANFSTASCSYKQSMGRFCLPCASPIAYTNYINNLKISNNNSIANYKVVAMGIGADLTLYYNQGWNTVKEMNYNPDLAIQVSWENINQAVQTIVDAACSS